MRELMAGVQPGLQRLFGTARPVIVSTSSATGLMETAVRGGVARRLLCLVNGAFSQRFADIAEQCGVPYEVLEVRWGEVHAPGAVADRLAAGHFDAVSMVHSETSTGALNDIPALVQAVRQHPGVQVLVDSVTGIGGVPFAFDEWGVDFAVTGSQKAMALPPGLAFGVASEAFLERARTRPGRGMYLDAERFYDQLEKHQTPTTPAVTLMYALQAQLARIEAEGLEARFDRHRVLAERSWRWVDRLRNEVDPAFRVLAAAGERSPTVTCVRLPEGLHGPDVVARTQERGWVIGGGYGKLKPFSIRIGHMGDHTLEALEGLLAILDETLAELEVRS
jgi:aspartate aminotransferase-like enzyme